MRVSLKSKLWFLISFICATHTNVWPQKPVKNYDFVSIKDGISKVGIYNIIQDKQGFIWLGTNGAGLYRYDGVNYESYNYTINDSTSLISGVVFSSCLDSKNRLWFGTDVGLNLYDEENNQFIRIPNSEFNQEGDPAISVTSLKDDGIGHLFIGTSGLGLFKMNLDDFKIEKVFSSESLESISLNINDLQVDKYGKVYAATNRGIKEVDSKTNTLRTSVFKNRKKNISITSSIESLVIDAKNSIWAGTQSNGLYKITLINEKLEVPVFEINNFSFSTNKFLSLTSLKDGTLMCAAENDGLFHIDSKGRILNNYSSNKTNENRILSNSIWSLYLDNNERIWVGYYNKGVSVYDKLYDKFNEIEHLDESINSLRHPSVAAIVQDESDKLWIATDGGGIDVFDKKTKKITPVAPLSDPPYLGLTSNYIVTLFSDSKKNIWAGSWDKGLFLLKKGTNKFINYNIENTGGALSSNRILTIAEDVEGLIWIGTFDKGLHSLSTKTNSFTHYNYDSFQEYKLGELEIRNLLVDSENAIWVGSTAGLYKIEKHENNQFLIIAAREKMPEDFNSHNSSSNIISIFESSDRTIWIGTRGAGLCAYDRKTDNFIWYNNLKGLSEGNINGIEESLDGNIWLSGNSGITRLDIKNRTFTNFTSNDGLLSNDYNINSGFIDNEGLLYFGNFQGVDYFDPSNISINKNVPSLYLTEFKLFNEKAVPNSGESPLKKRISKTDSLTLNSKQSVFTIEYSSINYTRPEKNEYAYYLEGYETSWNYVGKKTSATYTNLDAGDYIFKLKAANNDGIWNESPLSLKITILPPWWKTVYAIFGYIALFLLGVYMLNKITQNRIKDKQLVVNERTNRALEKELNEKKLQFFTNISHEFRTPLSLIIGPLEDIIKNDSSNLSERVNQKHYTIHKNTKRLNRLINELLDFRKLDLGKVNVKVRKLNLVSFTSNVMNHFKEEAFIRNIHLSLDSDFQDISVWADENMLEKIIFNILSNAFKVTPESGAVTIDLSSKDDLMNLPLADKENKVKFVEITISDTGPGLKKEQLKKIFERFYQLDNLNKSYYGTTGIGLEVVRNFVELHKGKIKVKSELGKGTAFKIYFPAGNKHFNKGEILVEGISDSEEKENFVVTSPNLKTEPEVKEEINSKSHTLLVVEDNPELRSYLKNELKNQYKILLAKNGRDGLNAAKKFLPDIIITDVIMPEMDGFLFCKHIKSDIKTSHIPLLMLTAKTGIENRMVGIENGADAYIVKPFDMGLLKLRLSQLITSRQLIFNKYFSVISEADNTNANSIDKEFIKKVLNFINESIGDPDLNVESLAAQLNLSRSQFYRKIKALTNQTANEFIRNIRMRKAKQIIEAGNTNISEVCYKVGFSSPSYFTKCFKNAFGKLPKEIEIKDS